MAPKNRVRSAEASLPDPFKPPQVSGPTQPTAVRYGPNDVVGDARPVCSDPTPFPGASRDRRSKSLRPRSGRGFVESSSPALASSESSKPRPSGGYAGTTPDEAKGGTVGEKPTGGNGAPFERPRLGSRGLFDSSARSGTRLRHDLFGQGLAPSRGTLPLRPDQT